MDRSAARMVLLSLLLLLPCSACDKETARVIVRMSGFLKEIKTWRVEVTLDKKKAKRIEIPGSSQEFLLDLPEGSRGLFQLGVKGVSDSAFIASKGAASAAVGDRSITELDVEMKAVQICGRAGFCWERPLPSGRTIRSIWGANEQDIWAVGDSGLAMHFDGEAWEVVETGTEEDFTKVSGVSAGEVYLVGRADLALRWNGQELQPLGSALGEPLPITQVNYHSVWAPSSTELWLLAQEQSVTYSGPARVKHWVVLHWNGSRWRAFSDEEMGFLGNDGLPTAIWGAEPGRPYVLGGLYEPARASAVLVRYEGGEKGWTSLTKELGAVLPAQAPPCPGIDGRSPQELYVLCGGRVIKFDGLKTFSLLKEVPQQLHHLALDGAGELWVTGDGGTLRQTQERWVEVLALGVPRQLYYAVSRIGSSLFFSGRSGVVRQHKDGVWKNHLPLDIQVTGEHLRGIGGTSPSDVWVAGLSSVLLHRSESGWEEVPVNKGIDLLAVHALSAKDVWAVGAIGQYGKALHWDGQTWVDRTRRAEPTPPGQILGVWGMNPNEVWAVGAQLEIQLWDGESWQPFQLKESIPSPLTGYQFSDIWGVPGGGIWAIGNRDSSPDPNAPRPSFLATYRDGEWRDITRELVSDSATEFRPYFGVWASGRSVWLNTQNQGRPGIAFYDGDRWSKIGWWQESGGPLVGLGSDDIWFFTAEDRVGRGNEKEGTMLRIGGPKEYAPSIKRAWASPQGDLFVAGENGTILHRTPH